MLDKNQLPAFIVHGLALVIFAAIFVLRKNYEFMIYIGVIIAVMTVLILTNKKMNYSPSLLWGLAIWSIIHMSGAGIYINGNKLYDTMILSIIGGPYHIFKYDQFAHIFGFAVATLLMYFLIKPNLRKNFGWSSVLVVVIMAGLGAGALNEIIEFTTTLILSDTGVGGYENTALDLVSNAIGSIAAGFYIFINEKS